MSGLTSPQYFNKKTNERQETLKKIAKELIGYDFKTFDPRKDKKILMDHLQYINGQLGKLLQGYE